MRYEGSVYRPPSEAYSLIVQATIGCSHNKCTFCSMYKDKKFRMRDLKEIEEDLEMARKHYKHIKRVFLADGNALALKTDKLERILLKIKELFPECERVGIYSAPKDILRKSVEELQKLKKLGLGIAYLGVESGSDAILKDIQKGVTSEESIQAGKRMVESGIPLSVTLISGLGGRERWLEHAKESARVINAINPRYLGILTLLIQPGTKIYEAVQSGAFKLLTPKEVLLETKTLIGNLNVGDCIFRSNHASNYVALEGNLPQDKESLLKQLEAMMKDAYDVKEEIFRRL
ncbi:radical SAM protein [Marinisporobacter balticus]|uniref:Radical SAM family protein n=1 Tax=Marinisporobacter balticus TaxID=2018667 RepID=A0A4R2KLX1_9FIRM|nr:radical SAM protein [Marinisporobacter balticus]TCO73622.1 radical SAM family protein [Marinisporobacter balticus]